MAGHEQRYLEVGRVLRPHGVHGALLVDVISNQPDRFAPGSRLFLGPDRRDVVVTSSRAYKGRLLVHLDTVPDRTAAESLRRLVLAIAETDLGPPPPGEVWAHELVGLTVEGPDAARLGEVVAVHPNPAHDLLECREDGGETYFVPMVGEFVSDLDVEAGVVRIRPIPGLVPGSDAPPHSGKTCDSTS